MPGISGDLVMWVIVLAIVMFIALKVGGWLVKKLGLKHDTTHRLP